MEKENLYDIFVDPVYSDEYAQSLKNTLESQSNHTINIHTLYLMNGKINNMDYFEQQKQNLENLKIGLRVI